MRTLRLYRRLILASATTMIVFVVVFDYSTDPSLFSSRLPAFTWPREKPGGPESLSRAADDIQPLASYPWISDSGQTLNSSKPPVYGLFVLLDLDSRFNVTRHQDRDTVVKRLTDHDFGFSSCHQVTALHVHDGIGRATDLRFTARGFESWLGTIAQRPCNALQYNLVPAKGG